MFRREERKYHRQWQIQLEKFDGTEAKLFWEEIIKLKPMNCNTEIPMKVYDEQLIMWLANGRIKFDKLYNAHVSEGNYVQKKWMCGFIQQKIYIFQQTINIIWI